MTQRRRTRSTGAPRLSREDWLARALELLAREGEANLHIESLCRDLGVTRGSFYWHFESREAFVHALVDFWGTAFTQAVAEQHAAIHGSPEERLLSMMELLLEGEFARFDVPIRALAAHDPAVAEQVAQIDETRTDYIRSLFAAIGFRGRQLDMRTRVFVVYHSMDHALLNRLSKAEERKLLRLRHALLTQR